MNGASPLPDRDYREYQGDNPNGNAEILYVITCPVCGAENLEFDCSLNLVCGTCGYHEIGTFT
jgi:hypothetical protein